MNRVSNDSSSRSSRSITKGYEEDSSIFDDESVRVHDDSDRDVRI